MPYMKHHKHCRETALLSGNRLASRHSLILCLLTIFGISSFLFASCNQKVSTFSASQRKAADSLVGTVTCIDSLMALQKRLESTGDKLGSIVALREWGKMLRNESRFDESLAIHSKGEEQAEAIGDTLEWVQALNNIGTDYRRMGVLDVAQEYHYRAWQLCKECTDTSFIAKKNRVVSLNGLGNVYITLGNYERADSALRLALKGEEQLQSVLGQAINYANLGAVFEHSGKIDSAWVYYRKSMAFNREEGSELGIALCHTYFGSLYEKAHQYDKATDEYETAYQLMKASKDEWHALNALVALAGIYHTTGNGTKKMEYLEKAKSIAERIKSPEHLADVYTLYYKHYKQTGDCQRALASYERASMLQDSVLNIEKVNRIQNAGLNIERNRQAREMGKARLRLEQERTTRHVGYAIFALTLLILTGALATFFYVQRIQHRNHLALRKIAALRENFFTNITHEFRTPLAVILGLSRDLKKSQSEETKEKAQVIERQGEGLMKLINQLLDISKIKSAVGDPGWKNGNIVAFLTMIVESYHDYARSHDIDLQIFVRGEIVMDFVPDYVVKVMDNLLSNAFKFTPPYGKVSVLVKVSDHQVLIDVSDTGKGVAPELLPHIFEPFYQDKSNLQHMGTGIGLALVKQIMDVMGGTITVESEEGKGTTFHIGLPIIRNAKGQRQSPQEAMEIINKMLPKPESEAPLADTEGNEAQYRLLVIEDNRDIAAYIGSLFTSEYAVSYAENGKEGLEKALEMVPDLIITDLMMPGMDGLEVCRQVRANEIISHIPIIIVTAKITEEERIKGIEAGADAYLPKPFSADELRTRVEKLLEGRRLLQAKFAEMAGDFKKEDEPDCGLPKEVDLGFLAKVSSIVYMQLNNNKEADVSIIASHMCMSPRQFHRKVNALTGHAPSAYILRLKIKKAKGLLSSNPQMTLGEVADKCGFSDYSNFVRAFKNICGTTPTNYRKGNCT